jgi:mxaJ protein
MGVRRKDKALRDRINEVIAKRRTEIDAILAEYGVPRVPPGKAAAAAEKKD